MASFCLSCIEQIAQYYQSRKDKKELEENDMYECMPMRFNDCGSCYIS